MNGSNYKCQDLLAESPENEGVVLVWIDGYLKGDWHAVRGEPESEGVGCGRTPDRNRG